MSAVLPLQVLGVQVGQARKVLIGGRAVLTAIRKTSVQGYVAVKPLGLAGDEQADLSVHGGLDKAIYAYPSEHYTFWQAQRAQAGLNGIDDELAFGAMGENLTLSGLLERDVWVGDVLEFAHCTLRVDQPREPCFKFNAALGYKTAVKDMAQSGFCGFYLSVDQPGSLQAGEAFVLHPGPRRVSIPERFNAKMFKHMR
jgi:MOSC domain-containing protein YiiM